MRKDKLNSMNTYECVYCGVTYRRTDEMRTCVVCGHPVEKGWFYSVPDASHDDARPQRQERLGPPPLASGQAA